jgi:AhpD family alkylhydroperoxidase
MDIVSNATLSPAERQLVFLTASVVNECADCTAARSTVAKGILKVPATVVAAARAGQSWSISSNRLPGQPRSNGVYSVSVYVAQRHSA